MHVKDLARTETGLIAGTAILALFLGFFVYFRKTPMTFSCPRGGQSAVLQNNVVTFSCPRPRFMVSCDERTVAFYSGSFWCGSFDGRTSYRFQGTFEQVK